jgi:hypothetical protein
MLVVLKIAIIVWLYSFKLLFTYAAAIYFDLKLPFARKHYLASIAECKTLSELQNLLSAHFLYRNDPLGGALDFYYMPHITFQLSKGDCDDFALLACDALARRGIVTYMASLLPKRIAQSHVICIYSLNEKWYWAENGFWYNEQYEAIADCIAASASYLGGIKAVYVQRFSLKCSQSERIKIND